MRVGISTPLVAHWPKGIAPQLKGKFEHQPAHLIDLMATCVDLAKADYPKKANGKEIVPMQGVSLKPVFSGKNCSGKTYLLGTRREPSNPNWKMEACS